MSQRREPASVRDSEGRWHHKFSQSLLNRGLMCPEQMRLDMAGELERSESDASAIGTAMHVGIEAVLDGQAVEHALIQAATRFVALTEDPTFQWKQVKTMDTACRYIENGVKGWYEHVWPHLTPDEALVEHKFALPIHEDMRRTITITGTWDYWDPYFGLVDWKGLPLATPIPTPTGWTTMGEVEEGDAILGADGGTTTVMAKSSVHVRPCYRLTLDDGSEIDCDNVHLWRVRTGKSRSESVVTIPELLGMQGPWLIDNAAAVELPPADLEIDPYTLGAWLGDGTTSASAICIHPTDAEIVARIAETTGYKVTKLATANMWGLGPEFGRLISEHGLRGNKHVPSQYLRGSIDQRLALLQGMMDTDGGWNVARNQATFDSTNKNLSDAVYELVVSLGMRASTYDGVGFCNGEGKLPYRRITFSPLGFNPFHLPRKASLVSTLDGTGKNTRRAILRAHEIEPRETQCIKVYARDSMFLAGRQMIPTHNTAGREYEQWEVDRFKLQPTVYTWAAAQLLGLDGPVDFTYAVYVKGPSQNFHLYPTTRHRGHWDWLTSQAVAFAKLIEADLDQWPLNDQGWLCSAKWCTAWDKCKGAHIERLP